MKGFFPVEKVEGGIAVASSCIWPIGCVSWLDSNVHDVGTPDPFDADLHNSRRRNCCCCDLFVTVDTNTLCGGSFQLLDYNSI